MSNIISEDVKEYFIAGGKTVVGLATKKLTDYSKPVGPFLMNNKLLLPNCCHARFPKP
jgi:hypothetical protein